MGERTIELEILRYNPETDSEPHFQRYSVPCRDEWVVLDALNHVKEAIDPTLSYRWSCHMAVCGSCGMMINNEPKLACKAFIRNYDGRDPRRAAGAFPGRARPGDRDRRFHGQAQARPAVHHPERGQGGRATASTCRRRRSSKKFKQYSMCINCMLCYAACPEYGLIPNTSARRRSRSRTATTRIRATAAASSASRKLRRPRAPGNARSSAPAPTSAPSTSIRRGPYSRSRSAARSTGTRST